MHLGPNTSTAPRPVRLQTMTTWWTQNFWRSTVMRQTSMAPSSNAFQELCEQLCTNCSGCCASCSTLWSPRPDPCPIYCLTKGPAGTGVLQCIEPTRLCPSRKFSNSSRDRVQCLEAYADAASQGLRQSKRWRCFHLRDSCPQVMREKYLKGTFGTCPRVLCDRQQAPPPRL